MFSPNHHLKVNSVVDLSCSLSCATCAQMREYLKKIKSSTSLHTYYPLRIVYFRYFLHFINLPSEFREIVLGGICYLNSQISFFFFLCHSFYVFFSNIGGKDSSWMMNLSSPSPRHILLKKVSWGSRWC